MAELIDQTANEGNHITAGKCRNVVFTANNYDPNRVADLVATLQAWGAVTYFVFGKEVAPTTGTPHLQGYLELKSPYLWTSIQAKLNVVYPVAATSKVWTTRRRGTAQQAADYCKKDGDITEWGEISKQGERTDLKELAEEIKAKKRTVEEIAMEDPYAFHKFGRTLQQIQTISQRYEYRQWRTEGIWYYGPTGIGKTYKAMQGYSVDTHYIKCLDDQWWDGYNGQDIVIFNEFRGQITFHELLDLADEWPKTVKQRNKEPVQFLAKKLIITCIKHPKDLFSRVLSDDEPWGQFSRRFQIVDLEQLANEANEN